MAGGSSQVRMVGHLRVDTPMQLAVRLRAHVLLVH